jgi:hypothetical protein
MNFLAFLGISKGIYYREICHYHFVSNSFTPHSWSSFHLNHRYKTSAVETSSFKHLKINHDKEVEVAPAPAYLAMKTHITSGDEGSGNLDVAPG